jgi:P27 family predicted phage terminase small subunit
VVPLLKAQNRFEEIDGLALAAYCQCVGRYLKAEKWLSENGTVATIRNDKGEVKSSFIVPHFNVSVKLLDKIIAYQKEFGLSPGARQKFEAAGPAEELLTDEDRFFGVVG